jgi:hypothetical protein
MELRDFLVINLPFIDIFFVFIKMKYSIRNDHVEKVSLNEFKHVSGFVSKVE